MSLRRFGVLLVAAALGIAVGMPPTFATKASSEHGRIAFTRNSGSDPNIWSMRPTGGDPVNLTADSEAADAEPSWRPDGRKLAFISNRVTATNPQGDFEIFVMHRSEWVVRRVPAIVFVIPLEHREIHHPQELEVFRIEQLVPVVELLRTLET